MSPRDLATEQQAKRTPTDYPADGGVCREFTWEEVAKHNTKESGWVSINGKVYDVTDWVAKHPGGEDLILLFVGRDATDAFLSYHPFSKKADKILSKYEIGTLKTYEFPTYKPDQGFYRELCQRVDKYFTDNKIDPRDPLPGLWRMILVFAVAAVCFAVCSNIIPTEGYALKLLAASVFGVCQVLPLLHTMHDCSHGASSKNSYVWQIAGRFCLDYYAGCSFTSWLYQHIVGHHVYTNVVLADPDLPAAMEGDLRRLVDRQVFRPLYAYQHLYLPPLYGFLSMKVRIQDFTDTFFAGTNGPQRVNPLATWIWVQLFVSKIFWVLWRIIFPLYVMNVPAGQFWSLFMITEAISGWYLAFNFQVSHVSTACDFPLGDKSDSNVQDEWAISQIKTSVDYGHGSKIMAFLCGALNYQTVHHLFPGVSQYHYPAIAPIVQDVCDKYKVKYNVLPDFSAAFAAHVQHLKNLGQQGIPAPIHMG